MTINAAGHVLSETQPFSAGRTFSKGDPVDKFTKLAKTYLTGEDFTGAAKRLLAALHVPKPAVAILLPIVANAVRLVVRGGAREAEREEFGAGPESVPSRAPAGHWADFLEEKFALGDGRWVSWGEATIADHTLRIAYLEGLRAGIALTMERHRATIERLRAAGASCLNELKPKPTERAVGHVRPRPARG